MNTTATQLEIQGARNAIADEVRSLIGRNRTSGAKLARSIGIAENTMSNKLTGKTAFTTDELFLIADHFGIDMGALLNSRWNISPGQEQPQLPLEIAA